MHMHAFSMFISQRNKMDENQTNTVRNDSKNDTNEATASFMDLGSKSDLERKGRRRRRRTRSKLKDMVEKIESTLMKPYRRQPLWLKDLFNQHPDQWIPIQSIMHQITSTDQAIMSSKALIAMLRKSKLVEVDAHGSNARAIVAENSHDGVPVAADCLLYVDNLPGRADDDWLSRAFSLYGRLIDAWVIRPKNPAAKKARQREEEQRQSGILKAAPSGHRKNKGFGFVQFADVSSVEHLLKKLRRNGHGDASTSAATSSRSFGERSGKLVSSTSESKTKMDAPPASTGASDLATPSTFELSVAESSSIHHANIHPNGSASGSCVMEFSPSSLDPTSDAPSASKTVNTTHAQTRPRIREDVVGLQSPASSSKRKNMAEISEPASKRSRMDDKVDSGQVSSDGLCNGHLDSDSVPERVKGTDGDADMAGPDLMKKRRRKRKKRRHGATTRQRNRLQTVNDKLISTLRIYSWTEWHANKKAYLEKQKQSYSNLKQELKDWRAETKTADGLLKRTDRYRNGKEIRGRDKLIRKFEVAVEMRKRVSEASTQEQDVQR